MKLSRLVASGMMLASALFSLAIPASAFAQSGETAFPPNTIYPGYTGTLPEPPKPLPYPPGLSSCFDFYSYGSVHIRSAASLSQAATDTDLGFSGTVTNNNPYPIVGATVYVKIFRLSEEDKTKNVNGPDVVDFFPATAPLTLKPGESRPISFTWHVPADAESGSYEAGLFIAQEQRFELAGLSFTDDVVASYASFSVVGGASGAVSFDKSGAMLAGESYRFAAYAPAISVGSSSIPVEVKLDDTSAVGYQGSVSWRLYYWDGLDYWSTDQKHLIASSSEPVSLNPGDSKTISYEITDDSHAVYYLVGTVVTPGGSKSLLAMRLVRTDISEARFSDVGITAYPLADDTKAYVCFHSTSSSLADNTDVRIQILKPRFFEGIFGDSIVASNSYSGIAPGALTALSVAAGQKLSSFKVRATLSQDGKLVDTVTIPYDCKALGGSCDNDSLVPIAAVAATLLVIIVVALVFFRRRETAPNSTLTPPRL